MHAGRKLPLPKKSPPALPNILGKKIPAPVSWRNIRLIRDGHRNKQIADRLGIAETTVNFHIKNLVDKLGANDRTHAVTIAVKRGLLDVE